MFGGVVNTNGTVEREIECSLPKGPSINGVTHERGEEGGCLKGDVVREIAWI